jgi:omega-6 fatty acid desaturase (delta-12 desaturase)
MAKEATFTALLCALFVGDLLVIAGGGPLVPLAIAVQVLVCVHAVMLFHDCLHGSALRTPRQNALLGRAVGAVFFWPYAFLRDSHLSHHKHVGLVDRDPELLHPTREDAAKKPLGLFLARLLRTPAGALSYAPLMQAVELARWLGEGDFSRRRRVFACETALMIAVTAAIDGLLAWRGALVFGYLAGVVLPAALALAFVHVALLPMHYGMLSGRARGSYARRVLLTSRSFDLGRAGAWLFANQLFHVEHHLFPGVSRWALGRLARERRAEVDAIAAREALPVMRHASYFAYYAWHRRLPTFSAATCEARYLALNERWY